ncbi:MAG: hypothetical protein HY721_24435 [Planctomycetes bacterium]|nr:hypothetical protein [Planctomycetota bacterium]
MRGFAGTVWARASEGGKLVRTAGFTILEAAIGFAVGITILAVLGNILIGTTNSLDYVVQDCVTVRDIQDVVDGVRTELRSSSTSVITIVSGATADTLAFQVSSGGLFGAQDVNGAFQQGWSIRYLVSGTDLVREVLDTSGTVQSSGVVAQRLGGATAGQKVFSVTKNGSLYVVLVRIQKTFSDSKTYTKSMQSTVLVKG